MSVSDERLIAYADGELSGQERAEVERALAADERLRARLEAHRKLRMRLAGAFDDVLSEPVPDRLMATLQQAPSAPANVIDFPARRKRLWSTRVFGAMAASLAAGLVIGVGLMRTPATPLSVDQHGVFASGALAQALDTQLAADASGSVRIGLTFRNRDEGYCRTFELIESGAAGLACNVDGRWRVPATASSVGQGEVRMASAPAIMDAVDTMIEGEPLDAEAERAARDSRWRTSR